AFFSAVGKAKALAGDFDSIGAAPGQAVVRWLAHQGLGLVWHFAVEIDICSVGELLAQLIALHLGLDGFDAADRNIAELEWAVAYADQAIDLETERAQHSLDLAVLAFAQGQNEPNVGALLALQRG